MSLTRWRVGGADLIGDGFERFPGGGGQGLDLGEARMLRECQQPADFDPHALANQRVLTEQGPQMGGFIGVAPVDRRNGGE